ncbi:MAG: CRTAC1 family protein [Candidatus Polarisedimenticolia bacterium]
MKRPHAAARPPFLMLAAAVGLSALFAATPQVTFRDVARAWGITWSHDMGRSGQRMMVETMGSGGGFLDHDNDGDLDIYLANGAPLPGYKGPPKLHDALYRNDGPGHLTDVAAQAGTADTHYGQGICAADFDNDGWIDLYLSNYGPNVLYRNRGDGTFEDVTRAAGVEDPQWGSSCAFVDYDADGDADLFVANYVDFTPAGNKFCGDYAAGISAYCHPNVYNGQPDILFRNDGDGTFTDVSEKAGLTARFGNGLGVVTGDADGDGDVDLYVANDKSPNTLYRNNADGTFTDIALSAGVAYALTGEPFAGMGTDFGDIDGDGDLDVVVTNLDFENNSLFRNEGNELFSDVSYVSGIGAVSLSFVGFGADFLDYDNDGRTDLVIANGHILDNAPHFNDATTYAQRNFVFHGEGGSFKEVGLQSGPDMAIPNVGRGLASGDVDNDGDLDLLVTVCGGAPRLFLNEGGNARSWVGMRLVGRTSNRSALGARVTVRGPHGPIVEEVRSGGSYQSQSDLRLHFGLGDGAKETPVEATVRWPSGLTQVVTLPRPGRVYTVLEGEGVVAP